jgi:5-carboxymethyl-2-hydroxymuconic-semialdehyde dehydrogenase
MRVEHLINGKQVGSSSYFATVNPATQEVLAEVASGGAEEINAAVAAAKAAFIPWAGTPAAERAALLHKLGELVTRHVAELAKMESQDTGQPIAQTGRQLVPRAADNFHYFAEMCVRVDGHTYPTPTHLNYTLFHPVGVCALISPWNVPFMTATWKVAPALAFGNTAVLKMSELSPLTAARLGQLALEAGIPAGVLNVVHGYGQVAGEPLCQHPDVRAISFTGSTLTGNRIVRAAGLKKFSMELGGKSPFVIFEDADLPRALDAALFMIFSNNGERCTAGSRILIQQSVYADLVARFTERARRIGVGDPLDEGTMVGPMISPNHLAKVRGYIELGPKEGATLLCGGIDRPSYAAELPSAVRNGNYVWPTVFADVDNRMRIAQEEIFGPVLAVIRARDFDHALEIANNTEFGLTGAVYSTDRAKLDHARREYHVGNLYFNRKCTGAMVGAHPFGGFNMSGTDSKAGGPDYLYLFTQAKSVAEKL